MYVSMILSSLKQSPAERHLAVQLCWAVQDDPASVAPEDLDKLIMALQQKQRAMRHKHATANMQLLLKFLQQSRC